MDKRGATVAMLVGCLAFSNLSLGQDQGFPLSENPAQVPVVVPGSVPANDALIDSAGDFGGPALQFQDEEQPVLIAPDAASYQFYITDLESRMGPYAAGLSEQLLGLGSAYQEQGLHEQAIDAFKRGVHIVRINEGLYAPQQIPLLERLIRSLVARGDYETADQRQYYLFRVQAKVYGRDSSQMSLAMLERAEWEKRAYFLALGDTSFMRLLTMWELYSAALRNIAKQEGNYSQSLLRPLTGLLQTQYLISAYSGESSYGAFSGNEDARYVEENRFSMVRVSNYKQGQAVITAMRDVYGYNEDEQSPLAAITWVKMGDWHLWHKKFEPAFIAYQKAWDEFDALEDGERWKAEYFAQPTMLPDMPGSNKDLAPPKEIRGHADVSYTINARGRVKNFDLVKLETTDGTTQHQPVRLLRNLKSKLYRPRFDDSGPVETEIIEKRYAY